MIFRVVVIPTLFEPSFRVPYPLLMRALALRCGSSLLSGALRQRRARPLCSVDESLKAALSRVAERVRQVDPQAVVDGAKLETPSPPEIPGVRTSGPKMVIRFTCTHAPCVETSTEEERTTTRLISKKSYEQGELCFIQVFQPC